MKIIQMFLLTAIIGFSFGAQASTYGLDCGTSSHDGGPSQEIIIRFNPESKRAQLTYTVPAYREDEYIGPISGSFTLREYETTYSFDDGSAVVIYEQQGPVPYPRGTVSFEGSEPRDITCGNPYLIP